ncbi:hypothetical protein [Nocardia acidivorans]|uniref:hypothetical protein n=1 Tax=Nocardia acidivorans TaxID=404580 RepID=UPI0008338F58|nr:hypothetical protein [Nocardia acidivorans]
MSSAERLTAHLRGALAELKAADGFMTDPALSVRVLDPQIRAALAAVDTALALALAAGDAARAHLAHLQDR